MMVRAKIIKIIYYIKYLDFICLFLRGSIVINKSNKKLPLKFKLQFVFCRIFIDKESDIDIGDNNKIRKAVIFINRNTTFSLGSNNKLNNFILRADGNINIGSWNIINKKNNVTILVNGGLLIKDSNRLNCTIWIRFNGILNVGSYNTFNEGTEIRCDENIYIGSFNQVSMSNRIWDTSTHRVIHNIDEYKNYIKSRYPNWDECAKPKTGKTYIGDCNWIGEAAFIKCSTIMNHSIIGTRTMIINKTVPDNSIAINKIDNVIYSY